MKRKSGVLMHISSLWGNYSCGGFGRAAREFVDFLRECGVSYWQVLPFCRVDDFNSPYKSYSTFAGNPYFIDLENLFEKGLITKEELEGARQTTPYLCEFERLREERIFLLMTASKRVNDRREIEEFISKKPYIENFCKFMALKTANDQKAWQEWTLSDVDKDILFGWKFIQYEFFEEWQEIKKYANEKGVELIGDMPIYVSPDSSDVYFDRDLFLLDEKGYPTQVAGVPPDYFTADGQLWGNPLYNWEKMKETGYKWWCDRVKSALELFDGLRIDHFRAFESFWEVPASETTAKNGHWVKGPGMDVLSKISEVAGEKLIIAEDLGDITEAVVALVEESGFPGMRVFQFGFFGGESTHKPHNYKENCIAYSGTHDNNTLLGYLWELDDKNRREMLEYCGYISEDWGNGLPSMLRTIWASSAGTVIFPIQDILGYGADTRLNFPGRAENNWRYRVTKEQIDGIDKKRFRRLNELYNRI
ncbi:MAG: 4-alpha-glucanotransferase [Clostridia bacterium]|nr:4-alpha-glucanotransferase [Clostridia bacterium]